MEMNMKTQNKPSQRWKTLEVVLLVGIAVFLFSGALSLRTQDALAEKVVRLHVLANSDSQEDQALKLQVRDRILALPLPARWAVYYLAVFSILIFGIYGGNYDPSQFIYGQQF